MKQISDKTHIIILTGDIRIWLNEKEFNLLSQVMERKSFINIGGRIINTKNILYAGPRIEVDIADKIKKGYWQCQWGYWHSKNEECAHGDKELYKNEK